MTTDASEPGGFSIGDFRKTPDGRVPGGTAAADPMTPGHTRPGPGTGLTEITAVEGTAAADLAAALALLPPGAILIDFGADAEASLFFGPPPGEHPPAHGTGAGAPPPPVDGLRAVTLVEPSRADSAGMPAPTATRGRTVGLLQWQRPSEVNTDAADAVEVADTAEGVLLRVSSCDTAILISRWAWADFLGAADAGEYDATLPSAREVLSRVDA